MSELADIASLLPHDAPMILIDRIMEVFPTRIHCQVDVGEHNLFFSADSQSIPAYIGIEFMAQSIAAWSGYHARKNGALPPIGFLLGCRRYHTQCHVFPQGQTLDVFAEKILEEGGMAVFSGHIEHAGHTLAQCQFNVYLPNEEKLTSMKIRSQV
ncbi:hotdog family protein [Vibrio mimicus]|nr:hotdog family protein [Vibrio mimicus]QXC56008.1 hotdog family protein [Vibrio mimicus]